MARVLTTKRYDFGAALELLRQGRKVYRAGWNASGQWVYLVPAASYAAQTEAARAHFGAKVPYRAYFALVTAQGDVAVWVPSVSDCLADDWMEKVGREELAAVPAKTAKTAKTGIGAPVCALCGELMPAGEEAFRYHGYSGPCPTSEEGLVVTGPAEPALGAAEPLAVETVVDPGPLVRRGADPVLVSTPPASESQFREGLRGPDWGGKVGSPD